MYHGSCRIDSRLFRALLHFYRCKRYIRFYSHRMYHGR
ncbi:hypothetical protein X945_5815 [Burkholderia pseudomallei ABCPW 107]|nr:hypothetical protein X945_5815 [Burkholderia pseudomallei ABCPW 107]